MDKFQDKIGTVILGKIIINTGDGRVIKRGEHIGFTLKILDDRLANQRIGGGIDHLLNSNQLNHIGKVQVTGAVYRPHAPHSNHILDAVTANQRNIRGKLLTGMGTSL
jgi:hypothetical protein